MKMPEGRLAPNTSENAQMSALRIKYDCGLGENGRTIVKTRSFSNVKPDAVAVNVYNVAEILNSLQKNDVLSVVRIDNTELTPAN
ncbi:hypothetical protein C4097_03805 [Clostridioides difficile]|jgi:hypothetical protein|uniref:DUF1659 domain-containing protein n=4 Tax=Bacillota TaxID=1239 RepID=UPI001FF4DDFF|nr:DUF1659 domain-containing protein [Paraclostridium bifermentans]MDB3083682.1 hypothetical protein [Clostridioides difficile]UOW69741.1 DUF1659 domain-containing protein [Paraclostridium bifermentans]